MLGCKPFFKFAAVGDTQAIVRATLGKDDEVAPPSIPRRGGDESGVVEIPEDASTGLGQRLAVVGVHFFPVFSERFIEAGLGEGLTQSLKIDDSREGGIYLHDDSRFLA